MCVAVARSYHILSHHLSHLWLVTNTVTQGHRKVTSCDTNRNWMLPTLLSEYYPAVNRQNGVSPCRLDPYDYPIPPYHPTIIPIPIIPSSSPLLDTASTTESTFSRSSSVSHDPLPKLEQMSRRIEVPPDVSRQVLYLLRNTPLQQLNLTATAILEML